MEGDDENEQTPSGETDETVYGEGICGSLERTDKTQRMTVNYAIQVTCHVRNEHVYLHTKDIHLITILA